eukprot:PITA_01707
METIETTQRRTPDEGADNTKEESSEEEEEEENETTIVIKMLAKVGGKTNMEIPTYEGILNAEELMDLINSLDKYFDYEEEADNKNKVKFSVTRLRGHATIWWDELQTYKMRKGKSKIKQWDKMVSKMKSKFMPKDYQLNLFKQLQNLRQKGMSVKEYTKEFYRLSIRAGHAEDDMEKVATYINGLRYDIQDEINLLSLKTIEDAYETGLKEKEKILRNRIIGIEEEAQGRFSPRGRGQGRDVWCYTCGEWGHVLWDCPHNKPTSQRNAYVAEVKPEPPRLMEKEEPPEVGESLLLRRTLLKTEKEIEKPTQRKNSFRIIRKSKSKCCKVIIDSESTDNLVSTEMVNKLGLAKIIHPNPYKVSWLQKGHHIIVTEQCKVEIQIGMYKDVILCDVMPMDVCHVLLGRQWKFDQKVIHDGRRNTYTLEKDGTKPTLLPLKDDTDKGTPRSSVMLMSGKELLQEVEKGEEMHFSVIGRPKVILTSKNLDDLPEEIKTLLNDFVDIVVDEFPNALPLIRSISHHIDLIPGASLPNKETYKLTPQENEEVGRQVQELIDKGLIRESLSPCVVRIVLSPKKGGEWKMCTDSRAINKIAIRIREGEEWKTAFKINSGLYEWLVMPFGLTNAPSTFMRLMNEVLKEYACNFVIVYLDDILIFSKSKEQHLEHLNLVLRTLRKEKQLTNLKKCSFMEEELIYSGFVVSKKGLKMDPEKLQVIWNWLIPRNIFKVRRFHGLASFYRKFIRGFSQICAPILETIKKTNQPFKWIEAADRNFKLLKEKIIEKPILDLPNFEKVFQVEIDASGVAIGAILS